ncbi:MAG: hypothetical protein J7K66_03345 [Anaerolineaceae bacterium]|nr:hypothetical protein [Anaerolineaceae bacterium]
MKTELMDKFLERIPARTIAYLAAIWFLLARLNIYLISTGLYADVPRWFPISVFNGPTIHLSGIPYIILFLIALAYAIKFAPKLTMTQVWLIGLLLIILGNLGQGNWDSGFQKPLYESGIQYYHDAIKITSWPEWLKSFNVNQPSLLTHARTHPPFSVLVHFLFLHISANSVAFLSSAIVFISSLSIILVWQIFRVLKVPLENRNLLAILFSVIPAVNIYSAVSLDGIILTSATLFLFGVVVLLKSTHLSIVGLLSFALGIVITNFLSYGGIFLLVVAGIQVVREFLSNKKFNVAVALLISIGMFAAAAFALYEVYGYDHVQGFLTASALENPNGFRGWYEPYMYLATRMECISENALFLSFGFLAILFHPDKLGTSYCDWKKTDIGLMFSGLITLLAVFASGAYRTGETARAALFIYPYVLFALRNADSIMLKDILIIAGLQTAAMQLFGSYFW